MLVAVFHAAFVGSQIQLATFVVLPDQTIHVDPNTLLPIIQVFNVHFA